MGKTILNFTDIHFGKRGDSTEHNELCIEFVNWVISLADYYKVDEIRFLGDWHDSRVKIGIETLNYSTKAFDMLDEWRGKKTILIGNHDMPYRDSRKHHSLPWGPKYSSIKVIDEPIKVDNSYLIPFLVPADNYLDVAKAASQCDLIFGHLELAGFLMNERYAMPDRKDHLSGEDFFGSRYVFSGHFHGRQIKQNTKGIPLHYIGNCFPHDFNDAEDTARGVMLIEEGKGDPVYIDWPDAPTFHRVPVSKLIETLPNLSKRATVKAIPDMSLSKSDRDDLITAISNNFELRKFSIDPVTSEENKAVEAWTGSQDVNAFVRNWLNDSNNLDGSGMNGKVLSDLYDGVSASKE